MDIGLRSVPSRRPATTSGEDERRSSCRADAPVWENLPAYQRLLLKSAILKAGGVAPQGATRGAVPPSRPMG
jgi:hypothetical protein